ncbi:MAG: ABC transporter substrate-binding protein [Alphaproteobacteria bacterium]|nr:ABC transporter substrate-binding protein [Alphaproteobacteria bacterium]
MKNLRRFYQHIIISLVLLGSPALSLNMGVVGLSGATVALSVALPAAAQTKTQADVKIFVEKLGNEVVSLVREPLSYEAYSKKMAQLIDRQSAYDQVGAFVLGQYNRQINDADRAKFKVALIDYFHVFFSRQFKNYKGQKILVENVDVGSNEIYTARINFLTSDGNTLVTDWRLWWYDGNYRVMDISVNNISMISVLRTEVTSIMADSGGDINQLVTRLRERAQNAPLK